MYRYQIWELKNGVVLFLVPKANTGGFQLVVIHLLYRQLDVRRRRAG